MTQQLEAKAQKEKNTASFTYLRTWIMFSPLAREHLSCKQKRLQKRWKQPIGNDQEPGEMHGTSCNGRQDFLWHSDCLSLCRPLGSYGLLVI